MNIIRYKQFIKVRGGDFEVEYWGLTKHGFEPPLAVNGIYAESFQSTGLHDQGDIPKEIFADDIIFFEGANCIVRQAKDGTWMLNNDKDKCGTSLDWAIEHHIEKITVIGDTMQNPDLMKVKK